jgi:hypothetical protein
MVMLVIFRKVVRSYLRRLNLSTERPIHAACHSLRELFIQWRATKRNLYSFCLLAAWEYSTAITAVTPLFIPELYYAIQRIEPISNKFDRWVLGIQNKKPSTIK